MDTLTAAEFTRRYAMRTRQIAWLLGAGASAAAGNRTAWHMISEFKAALFAQAHNLPRREIDIDDPAWVDRIQRYFDNAHGFPPADDPREYEVAFETMYPDPRDRRTYIDSKVTQGAPSYGHRVMAALITAGHLPLVFTPNFDPLIENAAIAAADSVAPTERHDLAVSSLNNTDVAARCVAENDWPLLVKFHGDYRSVALKNVTSELRTQDKQLREVMTESLRRFGLAVVGYSGRDDSVMEALQAALDAPHPYPGGLFWVRRSDGDLMPAVLELLEAAESRGVQVAIVNCDTFDELFGEVARHFTFADALLGPLTPRAASTDVIDVELPSVRGARFPALRFNALPLEQWPKIARGVMLPTEPDDLRETLKRTRAQVTAVNRGRQLLAFGSDDELRRALDLPSLEPVEVQIDISDDTVAHGLVYQALTRALARGRPLRPLYRSKGHALVIRQPRPDDDNQRVGRDAKKLKQLSQVYRGDLYGTVPGQGVQYAEAVNLRLEQRLDRWWMIFEPTTWISRRDRSDAGDRDPVAAWLRERWFKRRNSDWASMVDAWADLIAPTKPTEARAYWLDGDGVDAVFSVGSTTAWAPPGQTGLR